MGLEYKCTWWWNFECACAWQSEETDVKFWWDCNQSWRKQTSKRGQTKQCIYQWGSSSYWVCGIKTSQSTTVRSNALGKLIPPSSSSQQMQNVMTVNTFSSRLWNTSSGLERNFVLTKSKIFLAHSWVLWKEGMGIERNLRNTFLMGLFLYPNNALDVPGRQVLTRIDSKTGQSNN